MKKIFGAICLFNPYWLLYYFTLGILLAIYFIIKGYRDEELVTNSINSYGVFSSLYIDVTLFILLIVTIIYW